MYICCAKVAPKRSPYLIYDYSPSFRFYYRVGFKKVEAIDKTDKFIRVLTDEMKKFKAMEKEFVEEFSRKDYDELMDGWEIKVVRCKKGNQGWGLFRAVKE